MKEYNHRKIEQKWQEVWEKTSLYKTDENSQKPKFYVLDMFPYPSGVGLHVGHPKGYIATDIYSRMKRMQGFRVLHPMGWDAFGLPAENYAIKNKVHPKEAVDQNVVTFKKQLQKIGFSYDWEREINTTDPDYYKWTQWIFLQLFKKGLAYESEEPINWCPQCKTGLANEDLEDGKCEQCGGEIEQKPIRQWVLKITDYADRLLKDLDEVEWEEQIIEQQKNWIGRSEGAEINFQVSGTKDQIQVFTTRPDTLFGATFMVLAPEHSLVSNITTKEQKKAVEAYIAATKKKTELQRMEEGKDKTGVFTGAYAKNPVNGKEIPIWISDYVLMGYGHGAIMAVPAHDQRDWDFAKKYDLPIIDVISPLFVNTSGNEDTFKEDAPVSERNAVVAVVKHWSENKYLGIKWTVSDWQGFNIGGYKEGESPVEAGAREITEEVGYKNIELVEDFGKTVHSKFYQIAKKENRFAHFHPVLYKLKNGEKTEIAEHEKALHEEVWLTPKEMEQFLNRDDMRWIWNIVSGEQLFAGYGIVTNSGEFDGLESTEAKEKIVAKLAKNKSAKKSVEYRMKDWVFSRQRYWGEPIPIIHCAKCGPVAVPEEELPVKLPEVKKYEPTGTGESPLANIAEWVNVKCPKCGGPGKRETNTMPQWAGSCWYYLRYIDPKNQKALVDPKKEKEWMPVDLYVGGIEHATRHLLYSRFWHKVLFDMKAVSTTEPFKKLIHVGLIAGEDGRKMSKRWGNVVNPDDVVAEFGADSLRVYEMFMGPFTFGSTWSTKGINGSRRFLDKVWGLAQRELDSGEPDLAEARIVDKTIKKIGDDIEEFKFNTAVSTLMILVNELTVAEKVTKQSIEKLLIILAPFAPHMAEELWEMLGNTESVCVQAWPKYDPKVIKDDLATIVVQINGKVRASFELNKDGTQEDAEKAAFSDPNVKKFLGNQKPKKVIYVPGKILNIVV